MTADTKQRTNREWRRLLTAETGSSWTHDVMKGEYRTPNYTAPYEGEPGGKAERIQDKLFELGINSTVERNKEKRTEHVVVTDAEIAANGIALTSAQRSAA